MKKKFFKAFFAIAAIATVGFGSYKVYGTYATANESNEDVLMSEGIEAEACGEDNGKAIFRRTYVDCSFTYDGHYYGAHYIDCLDGGNEECQPTDGVCVID